MKRPVVAVSVTDAATLTVLHHETRGAWNSALRASEAAVRAIARREGQLYSGATPSSVKVGDYHGPESVYWRLWTGDDSGRALRVKVEWMP